MLNLCYMTALRLKMLFLVVRKLLPTNTIFDIKTMLPPYLDVHDKFLNLDL